MEIAVSGIAIRAEATRMTAASFQTKEFRHPVVDMGRPSANWVNLRKKN
jgi:hypothetical protein